MVMQLSKLKQARKHDSVLDLCFKLLFLCIEVVYIFPQVVYNSVLVSIAGGGVKVKRTGIITSKTFGRGRSD